MAAPNIPRHCHSSTPLRSMSASQAAPVKIKPSILKPRSMSLLAVSKAITAPLLWATSHKEGEAGGCSLHASDTSEADSRSHTRFPLTPTLSLGERESHFPSFDEPETLQSPDACARALPLPKGEGWGEGEVRIRPGPWAVEDPCKVQPLAPCAKSQLEF